MKNTLLDRGILLPTGEISKDKINLVADAVTQLFAEMVWVSAGGEWETINRLTEILVTMNTAEDGGKLFKIVQLLYGLVGPALLRGSRRYGPAPGGDAVFSVFAHR